VIIYVVIIYEQQQKFFLDSPYRLKENVIPKEIVLSLNYVSYCIYNCFTSVTIFGLIKEKSVLLKP
jgi:hypothetical protein